MRRATFSQNQSRHSVNPNTSRASFIEEPRRRDLKHLRDKSTINCSIQHLETFLKAHSFTANPTNYRQTINATYNSQVTQNSKPLFNNPMCPSAKEVSSIFLFLFRFFDANFAFNKYEDDVINFMKILRYPFISELNKSQFIAVTPHTWPILLAALVWIIGLIEFYDTLIDKISKDSCSEIFNENAAGSASNLEGKGSLESGIAPFGIFSKKTGIDEPHFSEEMCGKSANEHNLSDKNTVQKILNSLFFDFVCSGYRKFLNNEDDAVLDGDFLQKAKSLCDRKYKNMEFQINELKNIEKQIENLSKDDRSTYDEFSRSYNESNFNTVDCAKDSFAANMQKLEDLSFKPDEDEKIKNLNNLEKNIDQEQQKKTEKTKDNSVKITKKQFLTERSKEINIEIQKLTERLKKLAAKEQTLQNQINILKKETEDQKLENEHIENKLKARREQISLQSIKPEKLTEINEEKLRLFSQLEALKPKTEQKVAELKIAEKKKTHVVESIEKILDDLYNLTRSKFEFCIVKENKEFKVDINGNTTKLTSDFEKTLNFNKSIVFKENDIFGTTDSTFIEGNKSSANTMDLNINTYKENNITDTETKQKTEEINYKQESAGNSKNRFPLKKRSISTKEPKTYIIEQTKFVGNISDQRRILEDMIHENENILADLCEEITNIETKNEELNDELSDIKRRKEQTEKQLINVSKVYIKEKENLEKSQKILDEEIEQLNDFVLRSRNDDLAEGFVIDNEIEKLKNQKIKIISCQNGERERIDRLVQDLKCFVEFKMKTLDDSIRGLSTLHKD
ncbi:hypothetical protein EDEG_01459 [Edhazardia aedis USNM 41457]|uniref:Kinetochore protein NDC80 n=1 Tax=Edhazardia aedis (strain USNM 41457) TaxID=1003232 RepID=J9DSG8_EDHAE|nr:hypothetical protein EDEG_01459 [Edhazardia aedis USNM 41457]|eukprot:EJW04267.1 hypothetical protein EDEG_01459 [Edhazardia aedis USNM 41457]